jgi:hypothetical protein
MPFCPNCQVEYREGILRCSDCDVELVDSLPEEESSPQTQENVELAELTSFPNTAEADMVKELLESNDISSIVRGDVDPIGAASGAEPITLLVEQKDLQRAQEIFDAYFAGDAVETGETTQDPE